MSVKASFNDKSMGVRMSFNDDDKILTAFIEGDIDHYTAKNIREAIDSYTKANLPVVLKLDFSGVTFMDSSGIGLIMGRFKFISALNGKLKVINIPQNLKRMIKLSGLPSLGIFEKEEF